MAGPESAGVIIDGKPIVPSEAIERAARHRQKMVEAQRGTTAPSLGGATWEQLGPSNAGGRIRAISPDPIDPTRIIIGAAGGGIWKSINGGASWTDVSANLETMTITSIARDPNDPTVLYAATGEAVFFGATSGWGQGIYKSTDNGDNWSVLPKTDRGYVPCCGTTEFSCPERPPCKNEPSATDWQLVSRVAVSPANSQRVLASTSKGVFLSCDGGESWEKTLPGWMAQVMFDPSDGCRALATHNVDGEVWYTTSGGGDCGDVCTPAAQDWTQSSFFGSPAITTLNEFLIDVSDPTDTRFFLEVDSSDEFLENEPIKVGIAPERRKIVEIDGSRIEVDGPFTGVVPGDFVGNVPDKRTELAWSRSNPNVVYASMNISQGVVWKSTDRGETFNVVSNLNHLGTQGSYANTIWVDPTNENRLVLAGVVIQRSLDGGLTRELIDCVTHPDHHILVEAPGYDGVTNSRVYSGNDGGIFVHENIWGPIPDRCENFGWRPLNNSLYITQFYHAAVNPSGQLIGGTQDNGVWWHDRQEPGSFDPWAWRDVAGGDGWQCAADPTDSRYFYLISAGSPMAGAIRQSRDGGTNFEQLSGAPDPSTPFMLDPLNPDRLIAGERQTFRASNVRSGSPSWRMIKDFIDPTDEEATGHQATAIETSPFDSDVIWVGHWNGNVYRTLDASSEVATPTCDTCAEWQRMDDPPGGRSLFNEYCTRIAADPNDPNRLYISLGRWSFGGYNLWMTENALDPIVNWQPITGFDPSDASKACKEDTRPATALPCEPIWTVSPHPTQEGLIYVGTWYGLYVSDNYGATWSRVTQPLPFADVRDLDWQNDRRLIVTTHGRGVLRASNVFGDCNENGQPDAQELAFGGDDCNGNGLLDECDIGRTSEDCDHSGIPDECETGPDCNANGIMDACEDDCNGNGRPDDCDLADAGPVSLFDALDPPRFGQASTAILAADFDNDGDDDLATAILATTGVPNAIVVYDNLGTDAGGSWLGWGPAEPSTFIGAPTQPWAMTLLDHNGDGHTDIAAIVGNDDPLPMPCIGCGDLFVGTNDGSGNFNFTDRGIVTAGFFPAKEAISAADFDSDGRDEAIIADTERGQLYFEGATPRIVPVGGKPAAVATGTFNPDPFPDVAVANRSLGEVEVLMNDGTGSFGSDVRRIAVGGAPVSIDVADINKDGFPDIAVATTTSTVILLNETDGDFSIMPGLPAVAATTVRLADIDRDTWLDIVTTQETVAMTKIMLSNRDGTFSAPLSFPAVHGISLAPGLFDGDGFLDVAGVTDTGVPLLGANDTIIDCNRNGIPDSCEMDAGAPDEDNDGLLDECEDETCDMDGDGDCDLADWRTVRGCFSGPGQPCAAGSPRGRASFIADLDGDFDFDLRDAALFTLGFGGERSCCRAPHAPGCRQFQIETCVCAARPECCDAFWTDACVAEIELSGCGSCEDIPRCGDGLCNEDEDCVTCPNDCGSCTGNCCEPNDSPGCNVQAAQQCVCTALPECCTGNWSQACADYASAGCDACCGNGACDDGELCWFCPQDCGACASFCGNDSCEPDETCVSCPTDCGPCRGPCCSTHPSPGCDDPAVQNCVCAEDEGCCTDAWGESCVFLAADACTSCCGNGVCDELETCETCPEDCGGCPGPCCLAGDGPGCTEPDIEECVCAFMPECCEVEWTAPCASSAEQCGVCGGDCCEENGSPGCSNQQIEACVCETFPDCCTLDWTIDCAIAIEVLQCGACPGSCCLPGEAPGCTDAEVQNCVCEFLPECCTEKWDVPCAEAAEQCGSCGGDCCQPNDSPGCDDPAIEQCVCEQDPRCCDSTWDQRCVNEISTLGCGTCFDEPP